MPAAETRVQLLGSGKIKQEWDSSISGQVFVSQSPANGSGLVMQVTRGIDEGMEWLLATIQIPQSISAAANDQQKDYFKLEATVNMPTQVIISLYLNIYYRRPPVPLNASLSVHWSR